MAGEWWEELPDADAPAAPQQETPEAAEAAGGWWEELPDAQAPVAAVPPVPSGAVDPRWQAGQPPATPATPTSDIRWQGGVDRAANVKPNPRIQAARRGFEVEGAPADLRAAYMKLPPATQNELSKKVVNRYFEQRGYQGNIPVTFDKDLDVHLFKDPADGKWKPLNDLGLDWQDAKDIMKYIAAPTVVAGAAGIGGGFIGSPLLGATAALLADVTVSGGFRANDVQDLIQEGLVLPNELSPGVEGAKESAWATVGAGTGAFIGKLGRKYLAGVDDLPLATDADRNTVYNLMQRYEEKYGGKMPDLPLDKQLFLVADTGKERAIAARIQARRESLERASATQAVMIDRREQNKVDIVNRLKEFTGLVGRQEGTGVSRPSGISMDEMVAASGRLIDTLEAPARAELARYDQALAASYQEADRMIDDLLMGARDPRSLPTSFKGVFDAAEENFKANMATHYADISAATKGQKVFDIKPLREELTALRRAAQQDARFQKWIFGEGTEGLSSRPGVRIGAQPGEAGEMTEDQISEIIFGQAFAKDSSGLLLSSSAKRDMEQSTSFNYDAINSALLSLRKRIREMPRGTNTDTLAQMKRVEQTLEDVRDTGLRSIDEALAPRQQALDATYKIGKEVLDRSLGKRLADTYVQPRPGMDGMLLPSAFDKLFKGDAGAQSARDIRTLMDMDVVMAGPNSPIDMLGVQDNIRRGLLGALKQKVTAVGTPGGREAQVITPDAFQKFKNDYQDAMDLVFSPEELRRFEDATQLKRALEVKEAKVQAVKEQIMSFPWGSREIADDPAKLMRMTWPSNKEDLTKYKRSFAIRDAIREQGDPEGLLRDYRSLIAHDMMSRISKGPDGFDPYELDKYLDMNEELLKEWYTSAGRSGTDMVEGLKAYAKIGQSILERSGINHIEKDQWLAAMNSAARAYVGLFTTPGRILTAVKQVAGGTSMSREADFILNPGKYIKNQEFYEILNSPQMRALNRAGGHALINSYRQGEEAEEALQYQQVPSPYGTD